MARTGTGYMRTANQISVLCVMPTMMLHTMTGGNLDDFPKALLPLLELPEGKRVEVTKELLDFAAKAFAANSRKLDIV